MIRRVDRAGQWLDSPFEARELLGGRLAEVVVAQPVDDGVDGGVEAREVARRVEQRAQPIGNLAVGHNSVLNNFVFLFSVRVFEWCVTLLIVLPKTSLLRTTMTTVKGT